MAGFGEEIGDAYIDVHASTRPFRREIKRDARRAGREAGQSFDDGFQSEMKGTFTSIGKKQERDLKKAGMNSGRVFADSLRAGVGQRLRRFNIDLSDAVTTGDFSKVLRQFDSLDDAIASVDKRFVALRRGQRLTREEFEAARKSFKAYTDTVRKDTAWKDMVEEAIKADRKWTREREKESRKRRQSMDREVSDTKRANKEMADSSRRSLEEIADSILNLAEQGNKRHKNEIKQIETERKARNRAHTQAIQEQIRRDRARDKGFASEIEGWAKSERAARAYHRSVKRGSVELERIMSRRRKELVIAGISADDLKAFDREYRKVRDGLSTTNTTMERQQRGFFGRMKGSRNDFLHTVGIIGGAVERLTTKVVGGLLEGVGGGISKFGDLLTKNDGIVGSFGGKLQELGGSLSSMAGKGGWIGVAVSAAAALSVFTFFAPVVGTLVSLVSGLVGILAALASTITYAVIGAIGSLVPIVGALAIGLGALAIAFYDTEGAYTDLKKAAQPLVDSFKIVRSNLQEAFGPGVRRVAERFADVLERLEPLFVIMGNAILDWMDAFGEVLQSSGMQGLFDAMGDSLPGVIRELGDLFNNTFRAIAAIITAAAPVVEAFLGTMSDAVGEWANWAASAEGQTSIRTWFEKAAEAAQILWDVIGGIASVLGAIFDAGLEDGNNTWQTIGDKLREFADWLRTDEGQEKLKEWYDRAMDLATSLGDVSVAVGNLLIELDDFLSSSTARTILDWLSRLIGLLEWLSAEYEDVVMTFERWKTNIGKFWEDVGTWWNQGVGWIIENVINPLMRAYTGLQTTFGTVGATIKRHWGNLQTALAIGWQWIDQHVFAPMRRVVSGLSLAFWAAATAISIAWQRIKQAVAKPINAVISMYTNYVKGPFERVARSVGLNWTLPTVAPIKAATGGVLPGWSPGRDIHDFVSPTGGRLSLSGGEAIMRPEWTRAVGGPKAVEAMNRSARRGGKAFAKGGVFRKGAISGDSGDGDSFISRLSSLVTNTKRGVETVSALLSNPAKALETIILTPLRAAISRLPGSKFGDLLGGITYSLAKGLVSRFTTATQEAVPPGAGSASGALYGGWVTMWNIVRKAFPWANLHSGFRPGAITATGYPSMHGKGRAIDITPSAEIFNWLRKNFPGSYELIFSPMGAAQLYKGRSFVFPEPTKSMHYNHIHWAMANGGIFNPYGAAAMASGGVFNKLAAPVAAPAGGLPVTARGGMFDRAQARIISEAGAEAVVPLQRDLDQVDPAVRTLSAFAQGEDLELGDKTLAKLARMVAQVSAQQAQAAIGATQRNASAVQRTRPSEW